MCAVLCERCVNQMMLQRFGWKQPVSLCLCFYVFTTARFLDKLLFWHWYANNRKRSSKGISPLMEADSFVFICFQCSFNLFLPFFAPSLFRVLCYITDYVNSTILQFFFSSSWKRRKEKFLLLNFYRQIIASCFS